MVLTKTVATMSSGTKKNTFWYRRCWCSSHGDPFREHFCVFEIWGESSIACAEYSASNVWKTPSINRVLPYSKFHFVHQILDSPTTNPNKKKQKLKTWETDQKRWFWPKRRPPWAPARKNNAFWFQRCRFLSHGDLLRESFCVFEIWGESSIACAEYSASTVLQCYRAAPWTYIRKDIKADITSRLF